MSHISQGYGLAGGISRSALGEHGKCTDGGGPGAWCWQGLRKDVREERRPGLGAGVSVGRWRCKNESQCRKGSEGSCLT